MVTGIYRAHAQPMYAGVKSMIFDQALLFGAPGWHGTVLGVVSGTFVRSREEPVLLATYGEQYREYRRQVPGWLPRLTPWRGPAAC